MKVIPIQFPLPDNEKERLEKLYQFNILDSLNDSKLDEITKLASKICKTQVALIGLIDENREWFKSRFGFNDKEILRKNSLSSYAIMGKEIFEISDIKMDERFCNYPLFKQKNSFRYYAAAPLVTKDNFILGTLSVLDSKKRKKLTTEQKEFLNVLAQNIMDYLELELKNKTFSHLNQQYFDIQSMVNAGAWEYNIITGKVILSDQIYEIYKIPKDFPLDKFDGFVNFHSRDREKISNLVNDCIQLRKPYDGIFEFYDNEGTKKWVRSSGKPFEFHNGKVSKIIGTFQDVTKQIEKEKELELVLNNISEGYFDWHIQKDYEYMSPKFWDILGYDPKTKKHHPSEWQKLIHQDDLVTTLAQYDLHIKTKGQHPFCVDVRYLHSSNNYIWIRCEGKIVEWSERGEPLRMVGSHQNIDNEKRINNEALIIKNGIESYSIVCRSDRKGTITSVNELFCHYTKWTEKEVIGQNYRILNSGYHSEVFFKNMWSTINSKKTWRGEIRNKAKDGTFFWIDATIIPMTTVSGDIEGFISFQYDITERKITEFALRESENRHKQIFIQSKDAVMTLNHITGNFNSCNEATLKLFKVPSESEFIKLGPGDLSPKFQPSNEESLVLAKKHIAKAVSDGSYYFEWVHQTINGEEIPCTVLLSTIHVGDKVYLQATVRDISKEKDLINKLSESNKYLDLALAGGNLGIWDWYLTNNQVKFNSAWAKLRGLELSELKMNINDWESSVHPEDLYKAYENINNYLQGKSNFYENIHRVKHKNGHWIYIMARGQFSDWDKNGKPLRFTGTDMDVTDLMSNKIKLDLFFKRAPYGFAFCDMDGKFIEINEELTRITGYSKEELYQLSFMKLTPEKFKDDETFHMKSLAEKGFYGPYRKEFIRKNEEKVSVKLNGFIVEDYDGKKGVWSIIEDISLNVKLEKEKNELLNQYENANQKLQTIFEFSPVVVYECQINKNWTMNYINSHIEVISGYKNTDFMNDAKLAFANIIHPEDLLYVEENINQAIKFNKGYQLNYRLISKSGDIHWVWEHGSKVPNSDLLIGVIVDITDKKIVEDEVRRVSKELNNFFSLALNYLCIIRLDGFFKKINPVWLNLGHERDELLSKPIMDIIHIDDLSNTKNELMKLSNGATFVNFENRIQKKDGGYLNLQWVISSDTESGLLYAAATDITERKKKEEQALVISEIRSNFIDFSINKRKFYEFLLRKVIKLTESEYGFIGVILEDNNGKYLKTLSITDISWNEETRKYYKEYEAEGLEFRNLNTLFGEVIKTSTLIIANDAPKHPKAQGVPKGHPPLKRFMGVPLINRGVAVAMVGVANKKGEYKLEDIDFLQPIFELIGEMIQSHKLSSELELQRKIVLHNAKLASIGELAAGVGHEINNPLAIIKGQVEMLRNIGENDLIKFEEIQVKTSKILKGVERIANIVKGLRSFSRADEADFVSLNISELLNETKDMLIEIYNKDNIILNCEIENDLWVKGNRGRLQQVFINIINNARDALLKSEVKKIFIIANKKGKEIEIKIYDTGPGVEDNIKEKIFDPFFTTKEVNNGTGIGLALVSSIIKEHGGTINLEDMKNMGACFRISLNWEPSNRIF
jgi:PAS domain S-box-containing protein